MTQENSNDDWGAVIAEQKAAKENKGNNIDYTIDANADVGATFASIVSGKEIGGRFVGKPPERRSIPSDPKFAMWSKIVVDSGVYKSDILWKLEKNEFGFEIPTLDKEWILKKLHDSVMNYTWNAEKENPFVANKLGAKDFHHEGAEIFKKISANATKNNKSKFPDPFQPKAGRMISNWIDRQDSWCADNKHTKILTASRNAYTRDSKVEGEAPTTIFFTDVGIPNMLYELIVSQIVEANKHWDIDVSIKKTKTNPYYQVLDALDNRRVDKALLPLLNADPMTAAERAYERYDLDKLYGHTTYTKLWNNLRNSFKAHDTEIGGSLYEELESLYVQECKESGVEPVADVVVVPGADVQVEEPKPVEVKTEPEVKPKAEAKKEEVTTTPSTRRRVQEEAVATMVEDIEKLCRKNFPSWNTLLPNEQKEMVSVIESFNGTVPKFKPDANTFPCLKKTCVYTGTELRSHTGEDKLEVLHCPVCGNSASADA